MSSTHIRTFVAIKLALSPEYNGLRTALRQRTTYDQIRWCNDDLIHLTVQFIGKTPVALLPQIKASLDQISAETPQFPLAITKLGLFGSHYAPRIVWLGLTPSPELTQFHEKTAQFLAQIGLPVAQENFVPHITLGRIKEVDNKKRFSALIEELQPDFKQEFHIDSVNLMQSHFHNYEVSYSTLHTSHLKEKI